MRGNLAEPNLTKRLALLAEARRDDPRVCQHLIEAKAEIERLQAALVGIAKAPREPPAAHFMRDIANAALRPELRDATGFAISQRLAAPPHSQQPFLKDGWPQD
jgi:hypothetical protein